MRPTRTLQQARPDAHVPQTRRVVPVPRSSGRVRKPLGMTPRPCGDLSGRTRKPGGCRFLAVTNVLTAMRSADEAKAGPTSAARPDVPGRDSRAARRPQRRVVAPAALDLHDSVAANIRMIEASAPDEPASRRLRLPTQVRSRTLVACSSWIARQARRQTDRAASEVELGKRLPLRFPSLSFRVDLTGHCAEGGGSEVLMQVTRSLSARIRKWLGQLRRSPAKSPHGAGAWGR